MSVLDFIFRPDIVAFVIFSVSIVAWAFSKLIKVEKSKTNKLNDYRR